MPRPQIQPAETQERTTVGRLGGLSANEADRGERALWLAGNGYRAALFHLGALTRLNELGLLAQVGTVGAVSGGSILAALLATRVPWPIHGAYRDWPERVAEPMRSIAQRNARARALLRRPFPGAAAAAALEERYARELVVSLGGESAAGPRFVFGASGLTLSGLAAGWEECVEWEIGAVADAGGYPPELVDETIASIRTDLDAFGKAEQAVLENHGYLLADAAARQRGIVSAGGIRVRGAVPPHPEWMGDGRVREALSSSSRRAAVGRLRPRRVRGANRRREAGSEETDALLARHRPLLQYDSLESCRADSVETICSHGTLGRCNTLHRADGSLIAAAIAAGGRGDARRRLPARRHLPERRAGLARRLPRRVRRQPTPATRRRSASARASATSPTAAPGTTATAASGSSTGSSSTTTTRACWGSSSTRATGRWCSCGSATMAPRGR